jgi:hypothetical protein
MSGLVLLFLVSLFLEVKDVVPSVPFVYDVVVPTFSLTGDGDEFVRISLDAHLFPSFLFSSSSFF